MAVLSTSLAGGRSDDTTHSFAIVTTSSIAGQCKPVVHPDGPPLPHLFIDEAHHAEAPTWSAFKERFKSRRVVQFTATPFREDGKPLDGDIIFRYPLKKAQQEGYFKSIRFRPVVEFNRKRSDAAVARKAIEQLREDAAKGHILMARVDSVARAEEVFALSGARRVQPGAAPHWNKVAERTGRFGQ